MGFTFIRFVPRISEWSTYPNISNQWGFWSPFKPSQFVKATFEDLSSRKPIYIAPYLLGGITQQNLLNEPNTGYALDNTSQLEPGLVGQFGRDVVRHRKGGAASGFGRRMIPLAPRPAGPLQSAIAGAERATPTDHVASPEPFRK
jgi:hypothetical protein